MLGRGTCLDGITELSGISKTAMDAFFKDWCKWVRTCLYPEFVSAPRSKEELERRMLDYAILGLNGAFFSMDAVHVEWGMCPAKHQVLYTGKEGYPTVAYNCCVYHNGSYAHVSAGMYGSANDKTLVRFDPFIDTVRSAPFFREAKFTVLTDDGEEELEGAYGIVDGGYHPWAATIAADSLNPSAEYADWRGTMHTSRKDVECVFGVTKARFRILKLPILLHSQEAIDDVFFYMRYFTQHDTSLGRKRRMGDN